MSLLVKKIFILLIRFYQVCLSPYLVRSCRFHPSCSQYAKEAITKYAVKKGSTLAIKRLMRCHPFGKDGYDPVP